MGFFDVLLRCPHKKLSFPITFRGARRPRAASLTGTYVVCLRCGHEFPYDWNQMKVIRKKRLYLRRTTVIQAVPSHTA